MSRVRHLDQGLEQSIAELVAQGRSPSQIYRYLSDQEQFAGIVPPLRTIQRIVQKMPLPHLSTGRNLYRVKAGNRVFWVVAENLMHALALLNDRQIEKESITAAETLASDAYAAAGLIAESQSLVCGV